MKLLIILALGLAVGFYAQTNRPSVLSPSPEMVAQSLQQRDARELAKREFDRRVRAEMERLGLPESDYPVVSLVLTHFPGEERIALAVAKSESGLRPGAVGDGGCSLGVFQINSCAHPKLDRARLLDPGYNVKAASEIRRTSGFWPWSVFKNKKYLAFL